MGGVGRDFLKHSLDILTKQTFKDFDVVITDNSSADRIKNLCDEYRDRLDIKYSKNNNNVGMTANINNTIKKATGRLIKILLQDDFLYSENALQETVTNFDLQKDTWMMSACEHSKDGVNFYRPFYPKYNKKIYLGNNTIGSPSVLAIKNKDPLLFDEELIWLVDCDYYKRCFDKFGKPKILNKINVAIRTGAHQITNTKATKELRAGELKYVKQKHDKKSKANLQLKNVTLVAVSGIDPRGAVIALEQSMEGLDYYEVVLISHEKPNNLGGEITFKQCKPSELESKDSNDTSDYSKFMIYDLYKYIDSEFALIVHNNGYVVRPRQWDDVFLKYDYIGAPWPKNTHFTSGGVEVRVGNGGFSLRSKKLMKALSELELPFTDNGTGYYNEDGVICCYYRKELEDYGIKFAPVDTASAFSREHDCEDSHPKPFGFHWNRRALPKTLLVKMALKKYLGICW